jgi:hypothetical protein
MGDRFMISRFFHAASRAARLLIFSLMLVAAESGTPNSRVAAVVISTEYVCTVKGYVWDPKQGQCVPGPKAPTGLRIDSQPAKPVCRPDQVLIAGKVCGCPAQTRAKMLSPGVFKCMPT